MFPISSELASVDAADIVCDCKHEIIGENSPCADMGLIFWFELAPYESDEL